ncbi:MFS transporter [Isoptericola sp. b441]|uniref:MFS transporter n=1 Tax=Actinotalea lenta TaxID=3064654 RepID=A0ABT9DCT2_9CELL|nr:MULTISPECIES: MFS transporter [unclassified Isoptericola]MDO8106722.1 MFS transporter [Isoptericola sp. b441]MDO8121566.1 MFS transporter [Isoptericola sp. b490]
MTQVAYRSAAGRWLLLATVLGSALVFLDATVVTVALPAIGADLGARTAGLQWVLSGYMLTLSALILLGGAYGDRYGRRRVFVIGTTWFTAASAACAAAPTVGVLIASRVVQGAGAALVTPGSLALIQTTLRREDRSRAIGAWSALSGVGAAVGPLVGGALVDATSWRAIFLLNVPLGAGVALAALRHVPESRQESDSPLDLAGSLLAVLGLGGLTYAAVEGGDNGLGAPSVLVAGALGAAGVVGFGLRERRAAAPMLPLSIFRVRRFTAANLVTFAVYGALGGVTFLLVVFLQVVLGASALAAGATTLPITAAVLLLSPVMGRLLQSTGPRLPLSVGPALIALGAWLMSRLGSDGSVLEALPSVVVLGVGLGITVTPVTATALGGVEDSRAGTASGVNNAVSRVAQLVAVAVLPPLAGLGGNGLRDPQLLAAGFGTAMAITAGTAAAGSVLAVTTLDA